jgi:polyisoprenoid-binding protein YceI
VFFEAEKTQSVTGNLTLLGTDADNMLKLRSTSEGTQWSIDPQGMADLIAYLMQAK